MKKICFKLLILACFLPILSNAQAKTCQPNLTPEQAFLAIQQTQKKTNGLNAEQVAQYAQQANFTFGLIDLNTATEAELVQLQGISSKKAQDIILYRETISPFYHIDDLINVKGIGKATLNKNRDKLTVSQPKAINQLHNTQYD